MERRVAVITGATSGIGRAVAPALADRGFDLLLLGRNFRRGGFLTARLTRRNPNGRFHFVFCDLSDLSSVRQAAGEISRLASRLDVLVNNAGARFDKFQESADGIELTFATNHLGHFLLSGMLMDSLRKSGAGRVITVSSRAHLAASAGEPWFLTRDLYDRRQAYAKSKLANLLFAFELARRMHGKQVVSNAVDPGVLATRFARNNGLAAWVKHVVPHFLRGELTSVASAGEAIAHLSTAPELADVSGRLFCGREELAASPAAQNTQLATQLWESSLRWTAAKSDISAS